MATYCTSLHSNCIDVCRMPKGTGRRQKKEKDPNAPKRPMSAFFWFCQEFRDGVRKLHPDWKVGDVAKDLARQWARADKPKYEAKASQDKTRYEHDIAAYKGGAVGTRPLPISHHQ